MKFLVIGSGGREHAIAKKLLASPQVTTVYAAPGNPGMQLDGIELVPISELANAELVAFAKAAAIDFTFVGPETALANGVTDAFLAANLAIFAPTKAAAEIESSKEFAKQFMAKYAIPTAHYASFTDYQAAKDYLAVVGAPIVIKADGLAAGKGVTVALDLATAQQALENVFADADARVVIEEYLVGEEFSLFSFVHGNKFYPMPIAQDHKRALDGDQGANTGGMGAYSPVNHIAPAMVQTTLDTIVKPAVAGLVKEGRSFTGILYTGVILTANGPKVIEFNARFGDPETQVVLPRLKTDLAQVIIDLLADRQPKLVWQETDVSLGVVVASKGYPGKYATNIALPVFPADWDVYYAGVKAGANGALLSAGGRVYLLAADGTDLKAAQADVYAKLAQLEQPDMFYRHDIGAKGVK